MTTETQTQTGDATQTTTTETQTPPVVVDPSFEATETQTPTTTTPTDTGSDDARPVTYEPTGDAGLDVALNFVGALGIGQDHPAMQATATGDFSLIEAHLATMGDKARGWEQMVALAKQAFERTDKANKETASKVSAAVVQVAGSQETWDAIKGWASQNATANEKQELNAMFAAGPVQARAAAILIKGAYDKAAGTRVDPANAVRTGASSAPANTNGKLSGREYAAEVRALHAKLGNRMEHSAEYATLRQRFARG